jgi:DNA-binding NarL/FixJ family response regulator
MNTQIKEHTTPNFSLYLPHNKRKMYSIAHPTRIQIMTYRIAIVDDKSINIHSLMDKITYSKEIELVFTATNGKDFLEKMKETPLEKQPQVVLMDIDMPVMNGIEAVMIGAIVFPYTQYVMLTVFDDDDKIFEAIKAGAVGYLLKDEKVENIRDAVIEVIDLGGAPMSPRIARKSLKILSNPPLNLPEKPKAAQLSEREIEILRLFVQGLDYKEVADKLFLSPYTVRRHIANIYEKLHISNKVQALQFAQKMGWM